MNYLLSYWCGCIVDQLAGRPSGSLDKGGRAAYMGRFIKWVDKWGEILEFFYFIIFREFTTRKIFFNAGD